MRKMYHLATCSTGKRIIEETGIEKKQVLLQDIKTDPITAAQLDEMKKFAGSYEALFSRRAIKYRELGLSDRTLNENDYRRLILGEYTFLKRPVTILGERIFIGNDKKTVSALAAALK